MSDIAAYQPLRAEEAQPAPSLPTLPPSLVAVLTSLAAAVGSWIVALLANEVPGAPKLDAHAVAAVVLSVFLGAVALGLKVLHSKDLQAEHAHAEHMAHLHASLYPGVNEGPEGEIDKDELLADIRRIVATEVRGETSDVLAPA